MVEQWASVIIPGPHVIASSYIPGTIREITVAGANLFRLAELYLGDATQWSRIAALNNLWDTEVTEVVTLLIPPYDLEAGTDGILGI